MSVDVAERGHAIPDLGSRPPSGDRSLPAAVGLVAAVVAAYGIGAACSWALFDAATVAVFYPPAGVTLGALLLTGRRNWGLVLAAVAATEFGLDVWHGQGPGLAAGFVLANTVEPLLGAVLLRRLVAGPIDLTRFQEIATRYPAALPGQVGAGTGSLLAVPVRVAGRSRGALAFGFDAEGRVEPEVASVAGTLAELAGQALERAELYEAEHRAAHQLPHALVLRRSDRTAWPEPRRRP